MGAPCNKPKREQWASGRGFILATIGSAVGLGNIWRFSYVAGENGGGAFLFVYLCSVILVGAPLVIAELALGRNAAGDAITAFERAAPGTRWRVVGWICIFGCAVILSYYAVIAGWALKYLVGGITGTLWDAVAEGYGVYFARFIANPGEPVIWQMAMLAASVLIVAGGIRRGIEAVNRIVMPALALFVVALAVYASTLPGAEAGWRFLLLPDWKLLMRSDVLAAALGQSFFSIGVGMAVFITYGSYMTRATSIPRSAAAIVVGDTLFAIVAGLAIFPAVFAFGMTPEAGPQLAFITLPQVFLAMSGGHLIGSLFFALLVCAALTSMVSLLEVPVAAVVHRIGASRRRAVLVTGVMVFAAGVPLALSFGLLAGYPAPDRALLDAVDQTVSNYLLPLCGLLIVLFVGWRWTPADALAASGLAHQRAGVVWLWLVRIVSPGAIVLILIDRAGII
jgi:NSS family neurotransmitter:Na+ symporter